ncbi:O-antigen/teichoic acid export membrane protein [Alkalibacillus filiformis]|uniref:O-antigen/teichoic acid export membrane protein n=1 Tax=Alkalibacillus filiformis TaxID=200990 RepID=A0ABU0DWB2_9BACI|nr:flippase [Alkalibacillus filiformis]MDQ0352758.1 O-antigen/teichoic acid export membrane protein [Alkalibacillus filiformis]
MGSELKNVTKQSSIVFIGKILGLVFGLLFNLIAARFLGAEVYGQFTLIFTFISFFPMLALLGLQQGLVYYLPKMTEEKNYNYRNQIISISYIFVLLVSLLFTILLITNSEWIGSLLNGSESDYSYIIKILSPLIILLVLSKLTQGVFRGIKDIKPFVINQDIIIPILKIISLTFALTLLGTTLETLVLSFYISIFIGVLYLIYKVHNKKLFSRIKIDALKEYKKVLIYSLPLMFTGFLGFISQKTDILMIGYFLTDEEVGVYRIALQIGTLSGFILVAFNMMFAPTISSLFHRGDMKELESMFKTITKWVVIVNLFAFSIILLLNDEIMYLFGEEFLIGSTVLVIIACGQLVNVGVGSSGYILIMTGYSMYGMYINILIVVINIVLNLMLIPNHGISGAAVASLVSVALANIIRLLLVYKLYRIHPYSFQYINAIFAVLISFVSVYFIKMVFTISYIVDLIIYVPITILLFSLVMYLFGLSNDDKFILYKIMDKIKGNKTKNN